MLHPRFAIIASVLCIAGCPELTSLLSGWNNAIPPEGAQNVGQVAPPQLADPNAPARTSPAAGDPVRVLLRNPHDREADCVLTMELIGREVHFATRRILAAGGEVLVGPDRAEIIRIDATYLGSTNVMVEQDVLRIGVDFQPGGLIEYSLLPPPAPTGACCFPDGTCELLAEAECESVAGSHQGDDTACDPNPCAATIGACCFDDGTCELTDADECAALGGDYQGNGVPCEPNPCPQPRPVAFGACCLPDGSCEFVTEEGCDDIGGTYQGDDVECDPNLCPQPIGACCFFDGTCWEITEAECFSLEGDYQGDFTTCDPNTCPQPEGACCVAGGECLVVTESACELVGGYYLGHFTQCDPNSCPQFECPPESVFSQPAYGPYDPWTILPSESYIGGDNVRTYENFWLQNRHQIQGLRWWGLTLEGDPNSASLPCEDGVFNITLYDDLDGQPGEWLCSQTVSTAGTPTGVFYDPFGFLEVYEFSTTFDPNMACGPIDGGWVSIVGAGKDNCWFFWATSGVGDGSAIEEVNETQTPLPFDMSLCLEAVPVGACCLLDGMCIETTADACASSEGTYKGDFTICDPNDPNYCPQPTGACCEYDGTCTEVTEAACNSLEGSYLGDFTTCDPNPCPQLGACCFPDGGCSEITEAECANLEGDYLGDFTTCDPNPCPQLGACCFAAGGCMELTESECIGFQGTYQGDFTTCTPDPCPEPKGACCLSGECVQTTKSDCLKSGGVFMGEGVPCDPNTCMFFAGDDCEQPIPINVPADLPYLTVDSTCGRGNDNADTCLSPFDEGEDIFYKLIVDEPLALTIELDPYGVPYTGLALDAVCPPFTCIAASTDALGKPHGFACQPVLPGISYLVVDSRYQGGCLESFALRIEQCIMPLPALHPVGASSDP